MKSIKLFALLLVTGIATAVHAQKLTSAQVPAVVKNTFAKGYPSVKTAKWEKEKNDFEASFRQGSNQMSAVFSADGKQLESEVVIKNSALPAGVMSYVKQHYRGAAIKEAAKITKASGEINYEAEVKGKDLRFSASGQYLNTAQD